MCINIWFVSKHSIGSEDIRAHEAPRASRPYSSYLDSPTYRSIYDEPATANERVQSSGYRYLPVSRDTYGYSPRAIYDHHYSRTSKLARWMSRYSKYYYFSYSNSDSNPHNSFAYELWLITLLDFHFMAQSCHLSVHIAIIYPEDWIANCLIDLRFSLFINPSVNQSINHNY